MMIHSSGGLGSASLRRVHPPASLLPSARVATIWRSVHRPEGGQLTVIRFNNSSIGEERTVVEAVLHSRKGAKRVFGELAQ